MTEAIFQIVTAMCIVYSFMSGIGRLVSFFGALRKRREQTRQDTERRVFFHSAAPWIVEKAGTSEYSSDFCIISDGHIIADVYGHALPNHFLPSQVNARLIAAAPDLFRLLQEANLALKYHPEGDTRDEPEIDATTALLRKVQYGY